MDALPPQKFAARQWRFTRKRRRSVTEGGESEGKYNSNSLEFYWKPNKNVIWFCFAGDSKIVKKDGENTSMDTTPSEQPAAPATNEPTVAASGKYQN